MKICSSYRQAVTHQHYTAALPWAKCKPHRSILLQKKRLTAGLCQCHYTNEDLLFIQLSSDPTPIHCSTALGRMQSPLLSSALQNRLTVGLCHCHYTYEDLLFVQPSTDPTSLHCSIALGKMQAPLFSSALQKRLQQACYTAITPIKIR